MSIKSIKLGVCVLVGMGLAMLLSVGFLGSEGSVSAQDSTGPVFVGAGDIASCDLNRTGDEATAKLLHNIVDPATSPTTVFTTGDNAYESGTASDYRDCYAPRWGRQKTITYPTVGNHEYYASQKASGYFEYFGADRVSYDATTKGYYSYNLGQWHMVALNSMCEKVGGCGATSPMVTWLKNDLAATIRN
jgi:acid phosphatase type 7